MSFDYSKITLRRYRFKLIDNTWNKRCSKCFEFKPLDLFTKAKNTACKLTPNCNSCRKLKKLTPEYVQEWYKNGGKEKKKAYYQANKKIIHNQRNEHRVSNPDKVLINRIRKFVRKCRLKLKDKFLTSHKILGCNKKEFFDHLIRTFELNYNIVYEDKYFKDLHIDHIVPLSSAKDHEEAVLLNHYTNLQFLHKDHNLRKKNKLNYVIPPFPL